MCIDVLEQEGNNFPDICITEWNIGQEAGMESACRDDEISSRGSTVILTIAHYMALYKILGRGKCKTTHLVENNTAHRCVFMTPRHDVCPHPLCVRGKLRCAAL